MRAGDGSWDVQTPCTRIRTRELFHTDAEIQKLISVNVCTHREGQGENLDVKAVVVHGAEDPSPLLSTEKSHLRSVCH